MSELNEAEGLSTSEATSRLKQFGLNNATPAEHRNRLRILLLFVSNPLVVILIIAALASIALGDRINGGIILALVIFSVALDSIQNIRSQAAVRNLQSRVAPTAEVLRDGAWQSIPRENLVPGDVVRIAAGDLVPADCKLLEERDLHVQESALTGESLPVEKEIGGSPDDQRIFLGTAVVSGTATALIENTGTATRFGDIVKRLRTRAPETEFERGLKRFGLLIMRMVIFLVLFAMGTMILLHRDPFQSLLFGVALAVGLTPEFLPMITTLTLAKGAVRMAKHKVIVKNLASIQNFGSMDILCSDKTGTLTSGEMTVSESLGVTGDPSDEPLQLAKLTAIFQMGVPSPLDAAILERTGSDPNGYAKVDEIPFDFERRRVSVVVERNGERLLVCKGAPEGVFKACKSIDAKSSEALSALGAAGYRVLAVASKSIEIQRAYRREDENGLDLAGFVAFLDPPLPDALEVLHRLHGAGVQVKVISGDSDAVCRHVCSAIGLEAGEIVVGADIDHVTDAALGAIAERTTVFARIDPGQKNRIILALKNRGHVVGYMGDGINDAPSLHSADIGISFKGATDVAQDAAQIILLDRSLSLVHKGILEGRMAFGNVMKYLLMGTSSNFGNMFSMAGAAVWLKFLPMLPIQILLNNLMYDLAQVTIPTDSVDLSFVHKPRRWDIRLIRDFMLWIGPVSSVFDYLTFWVMLNVFHADEALFHTGWFVESLATQTLVIFVIRTRKEPWKSMPSKAMAATTLIIVLAGIVLPYTSLAQAFGFVPLPPAYFAFLGAATLIYLMAVDLMKRKIMSRLAF